jgi:hypothetical protein
MLWKLLLAHVITDFVLQSKRIADNKNKFIFNLLHCSIFFIISTLLIINDLNITNLLIIAIISILHGLIDFGKAKLEEKDYKELNWVFFTIDQLLHIATIIIVLSIFNPQFWSLFHLKVNVILLSRNWFKTLLFFLIITFGGSYFTASVCKRFTPKKNNDNSLESAGRYIGILERVIIFSSILVGRYELIGFLIAAKSIIRHHETGNKAFTEYFLIGTFTSFIWAAGFTFLYLKI